jgi:thiol-disulfide isomerase/thioredoxin
MSGDRRLLAVGAPAHQDQAVLRLASIPLLGLLVLVGLDASCNSVKEAHADCGESDQCRPELSGDSLDGTRVEEAGLAGKVVIVNFWATWCGPCRQEIPALETVWKEHAHEGLAMVGVLTADAASDSTVQAFMVESGMTYPVLRDESELRAAAQVQAEARAPGDLHLRSPGHAGGAARGSDQRQEARSDDRAAAQVSARRPRLIRL